MVVAVEKGLDDVKSYLQSRGYEVLDISENRVFDAVVFKNTNIGEIPVRSNTVSSMSGRTSGVFLVCAKNRTPEEIERVLSKKSYTNLF